MELEYQLKQLGLGREEFFRQVAITKWLLQKGILDLDNISNEDLIDLCKFLDAYVKEVKEQYPNLFRDYP